jgi:enamine deaminase RidA (YjgF/YER057c/UK114 family)
MSQAVAHGGIVYLAGQVGRGVSVSEQTEDILQAVSGLFVKAPRHELIDAGAWKASCDGLECCIEIGVWLDAVELAGFDAGPGSAAFVMPCRERVLAIEGNGADCALDNVAVHLDGAVIKE